MLELSEDVGLVLEALHAPLRGGPRAHDLERHGPAGLLLHRFVHRAHAAAADEAHDAEAPDPLRQGVVLVLRAIRVRAVGFTGGCREETRRSSGFEERVRLLIREEQALHFPPELEVAAAGLVEEPGPLGGRQLAGAQEEFGGLAVHSGVVTADRPS